MARRQTPQPPQTPGTPGNPGASSTDKSTIHVLTRNSNGCQAGETFRTDQAQRSGIDPQRFDPPLPGKVTDRAIKAPN